MSWYEILLNGVAISRKSSVKWKGIPVCEMLLWEHSIQTQPSRATHQFSKITSAVSLVRPLTRVIQMSLCLCIFFSFSHRLSDNDSVSTQLLLFGGGVCVRNSSIQLFFSARGKDFFPFYLPNSPWLFCSKEPQGKCWRKK